MIGGLVRLYFDKKKEDSEAVRKEKVDRGILYSSGLIAGEGLVGILLAFLAVIKIDGTAIGDMINLSGIINLGNIGGIVFFVILTATLWKAIVGKKGNK